MQDEEVLKVLADPRKFIETFLNIVDKNRRSVPFLFNPAQSKYYSNRTKNDLILKARKQGFSSLIEALWLHSCMFVKNTRAVILSHELDSTKRHFERIKYYLDTMGDRVSKFNVQLDTDSQKNLKFPGTNSSFWIGTAGAKAFGRGDDITHLHLSEVAHYASQDVLTSVMEACVPGAWKVMETTANGIGEQFYKLWMECKDPKVESPWKPHFFAWFDDPMNRKKIPGDRKLVLTPGDRAMKSRYSLDDEQIYWHRCHRKEMTDKSKMPQEHPSNDREAFLSSGRPVFDVEKIDEKMDRTIKPRDVGDLTDDGHVIKFVYNPEGNLKIWKPPRRQQGYLICADVAEGVADGNFSVCHVLDRSTWEQVAMIRLRVDPGEWGRMLVILGIYYNNAVLVPELNNNGWATIEAIKAQGYPHLLNTRELWKDDAHKDGFPTNSKTRSLAITALRNAVSDDTIFFNDEVTLNEMETFVQNENTGKLEAQKGCLDDCVLAMAIGAYCLSVMTLEETYAERVRVEEDRGPISVQSIVGRSSFRRRRTA